MPKNKEDYTSGISVDGIEPLAAVIYAASEDGDKEFMRMVGSTVLNRLESGRSEFGAQNGLLSEVIHNPKSPYYEKNSELFEQFMRKEFKTEAEKKRRAEAMSTASALMRQTVDRVPGEFWHNDYEINRMKNTPGAFDYSLVDKVGEYVTKKSKTKFTVFAYKDKKMNPEKSMSEYGFDNVKDFQQFLVDNGQNPGAIDGVYGKKTHKAYLSLKQKSAGKR